MWEMSNGRRGIDLGLYQTCLHGNRCGILRDQDRGYEDTREEGGNQTCMQLRSEN